MPCWRIIWFLRGACDLKRLSHNGHLYGSSPVWILMCVWWWLFRENERLQSWQIYWRGELVCGEPSVLSITTRTTEDGRSGCWISISKLEQLAAMWSLPPVLHCMSSCLAAPWQGNTTTESAFNCCWSAQTGKFPWRLAIDTCWVVSIRLGVDTCWVVSLRLGVETCWVVSLRLGVDTCWVVSLRLGVDTCWVVSLRLGVDTCWVVSLRLGADTCWVVSLRCFKPSPGKTPEWDLQHVEIFYPLKCWLQNLLK